LIVGSKNDVWADTKLRLESDIFCYSGGKSPLDVGTLDMKPGESIMVDLVPCSEYEQTQVMAMAGRPKVRQRRIKEALTALIHLLQDQSLDSLGQFCMVPGHGQRMQRCHSTFPKRKEHIRLVK
jgi:hypothetical protein